MLTHSVNELADDVTMSAWRYRYGALLTIYFGFLTLRKLDNLSYNRL